MPDEHHESPAPSQPAPLLHSGLPTLDGDDYPLGCECANPTLQIDAWREYAASAPVPG